MVQAAHAQEHASSACRTENAEPEKRGWVKALCAGGIVWVALLLSSVWGGGAVARATCIGVAVPSTNVPPEATAVVEEAVVVEAAAATRLCNCSVLLLLLLFDATSSRFV